MSKKHHKTTDRQPQPRPKKANWLAIGVIAVMIIALIALLTRHPNEGAPPSNITTGGTPSAITYEFHKEGELRFFGKNQQLLATIDIEIARDELERETGLMYREKMAENQGMLFLFDDSDVRSFWMKNTLISLDMIFVDEKDQIITIQKHTTPLSEQSYVSSGPAKYVLEVNAGFTDKHRIKVGDRIAWTAL
jgi:uncharacterized membrane protein (UPF0127 family)